MKGILDGLMKEKKDNNESYKKIRKDYRDYKDYDDGSKRGYQPTKSELDDDNPPEDDD